MIKGENVTSKGFNPKLYLSLRAIEEESLLLDQGTIQSYALLFFLESFLIFEIIL